jgi:hypothetical protein
MVQRFPSDRLWPWLGCRAGRQAHGEHRTLARLARHRYVAAHHARELPGDGKAKPRAAKAIISVSPMMAFSGVRSSWLTLDTNCDLCSLACWSWRFLS